MNPGTADPVVLGFSAVALLAVAVVLAAQADPVAFGAACGAGAVAAVCLHGAWEVRQA